MLSFEAIRDVPQNRPNKKVATTIASGQATPEQSSPNLLPSGPGRPLPVTRRYTKLGPNDRITARDIPSIKSATGLKRPFRGSISSLGG